MKNKQHHSEGLLSTSKGNMISLTVHCSKQDLLTYCFRLQSSEVFSGSSQQYLKALCRVIFISTMYRLQSLTILQQHHYHPATKLLSSHCSCTCPCSLFTVLGPFLASLDGSSATDSATSESVAPCSRVIWPYTPDGSTAKQAIRFNTLRPDWYESLSVCFCLIDKKYPLTICKCLCHNQSRTPTKWKEAPHLPYKRSHNPQPCETL